MVLRNDSAATGAADNAYETINLSATANTNTNIGLADATSGILSTTTVNVSGAGLITLWGQVVGATENHFTKVTTINASTDTGGLTVTGGISGGGSGFLTGEVITSSRRCRAPSPSARPSGSTR